MMKMKKTMTILVFSIFTLSFAAAAAILDIFSQSSFWKKTKKKIQQQEEKPNPGGGGGGSTSISTAPGPDDRISELPVEILYRILGFLEMDELLIGTSLVSTKWRNLWKSVPVLNFSHGHNVEKHHKFVDHVLRLRDSEASKIQIFRYYCYSELRDYDYLEDLHDFTVSALLNQGAQEIHVQAYNIDESSDNRIIHFNPSIFNSGRLLRKFTFYVFTSHFQIQFPRSMCCATQLTHLSLAGIILPEGDEDAQLHLVCPFLETFHMSYCYSKHLKVLGISAPRLDFLYIDNKRFGGYDILGGCRIEIHTPNLTSLAYYGRVYVDCFTENLPRIATASLLFSEEPGMVVVEQTTSFAIKLLKGLTSAENLTLGGFKFFSQDTLKDLLTPFTSLRTLKLATNCNISSIHGMVHLLNNCNSLEKLSWNVNELVEVERDEHLMLPQCRLSHLKHIHIRKLYGHENEIEFVKLLLKSSVVLEEITIETTAHSPKQSIIEENLKQFIEEEQSFRSIKLCVLQVERNVFYDL